jgi:hypothetical protein
MPQFLQRQADGRFLFRVYLRFALRIRDDVESPVDGFRLLPSAQNIAAEGNRLRLLKGFG